MSIGLVLNFLKIYVTFADNCGIEGKKSDNLILVWKYSEYSDKRKIRFA